MKKNKKWIYLAIVLVVVAGGVVLHSKFGKKPDQVTFTEVKPVMGDVNIWVSSVGTVQPQNRVEVKPSVSGRIEKILVAEGNWVKAGQTLALMSSTERATLLDAARLKGGDAYKYWENVYKPIALIAPITGEVVLMKSEAGQTLNLGDVVMALSDRLIVMAQVDETDIGKVKLNQDVDVILDAYSNNKATGKITHISYESTVVNNVTVYDVEITMPKIPSFFRSGMSANTNILVNSKTNVLTLPLSVIKDGQHGKFVLVKGPDGKPKHKRIKTGLSNESTVEVVSGITMEDVVLLKSQKYSLGNKNNAGNPLMMNRRSGGAAGGARGGH